MGWYKTGTIAISGVTVTGTGTNWTDNKQGIGPGQALLIPAAGTVKMYEILRVDSATKLTLTSDAGSVAAGQAYAIMSFYSDSVPDFARRLSAQLSYYQTQMDGWQQIMTGTGSINLTAPDGATVTISSFKKLTDDMNNKADKGDNSDITSLSGLTTALSIQQGGTGATKAADARTNLGLGSSATRNALSTSGEMLSVGDFGIGATNGASLPMVNDTDITSGHYRTGFFRQTSQAGQAAFGGWGAGVYLNNGGNISASVYVNGGKNTLQMRVNYVGDIRLFDMYGTGNTTKASDGTLKAASPVARIVKSQAETERTDLAEEGFTWCGCGTANAEAEGISISRLDVGVYVLTGSAGLASEGWQLLPPMDPGGMGEMGVVEAEETESGGITIRLYERKYKLSNDGDIVKTKGSLIDVPANSWIDVRLDMPESSIWNQRNAEQSAGAEG